MRKVILLLILILPTLLFSQKKKSEIYTVSGKILDAITKKPIEDATIIFKDTDSTQIKCGAITNQHGFFSIDVSEGNYYASVEFLSYKSKKLNISTITRDLNIGTIELEIDTEFLNEIEVISEKKGVEFKNNKIIFNVERDISSAGSSATEILNNIPSINVDPDGSISLRGQGGVTVMINGKTSSMSKNEALKSLPAGSIEKIEVITNPGAKFKASSNGIINIILKKGKDEGLNASITTTGGYKDYYGGLITLNHKSKGVNFFTNTSYSQSNPITTANTKSEYFINNVTTSFLNEESEFNNKRNGFNSTIGADYFLSKNTTLNTTFNYTKLDFNSLGGTKSIFLNAAQQLIFSNHRTFNSDFSNEIFEFMIDLEHKFTKVGRSLNTNISYTKDDENRDNKVTNTNTSFTNETYYENVNLKNAIFDISYVNPFGKSSTVTLGYNGEFGKVPFHYTGTFTNNNIDYHENIHQGYLDYEFENEKIYFNLGIRGEFQESTVTFENKNLNYDNNHNDYFPSSSLNYSINDSNSVELSFNTGIQRLTPRIMQPYEEKISATSSYIGNPIIKPVDIYKGSLTYSYIGERLTISPNFFYEIYENYWERVTYETGELINGISKLITTPQNAGKLNYYGLNLTTTYKVSNMLNFTGNILLVNFDRTGNWSTEIGDEVKKTITKDYNYDDLSGSFSLLTQLKIPNVFDLQINAKHQLKSESLYFTRKARTYASIALNKDLFNKDASINLTVDDVFKSNSTDRNRFDTNYFSTSLIENKYRTILLSFTYRFNQSKKDRRVDFDKKDIKPNY